MASARRSLEAQPFDLESCSLDAREQITRVRPAFLTSEAVEDAVRLIERLGELGQPLRSPRGQICTAHSCRLNPGTVETACNRSR